MRGRPFKKGTPKPPNSGRKRGVQNKVTVAVKEFFRQVTEDPQVQDAFRRSLIGRDPGSMQAFIGSAHMVVGKPKESVEVSTSPSMSKLILMALQTANEIEAGQKKTS